MIEARAQSALELQMKGYRLSTAEILYHLPDHPRLIQSFIWQHYDLAPEFPELKRFLEFWGTNIDGKIHSVRVGRTELVKAAELDHVDGVFLLN